MKPLPEEFRRDGFNFRLLLREGQIALLVKQKTGSEVKGYEVVIIRRNAARVMAGVNIEAQESMPGNEQWGTYGWTFSAYEPAKSKFAALTNAPRPCPNGSHRRKRGDILPGVGK